MTFNNILDLQTLLVSTLSGDWTIFLFIALIFITMLAARFKMNNIIMFMIMGLFGILFSTWINWFYIIIIIFGGLIISFIIAKLIKN